MNKYSFTLAYDVRNIMIIISLVQKFKANLLFAYRLQLLLLLMRCCGNGDRARLALAGATLLCDNLCTKNDVKINVAVLRGLCSEM